MGRTLPWKKQGVSVGVGAGDVTRIAFAKSTNVGVSSPRESPPPPSPSTPSHRARRPVTKSSTRPKASSASPSSETTRGTSGHGLQHESQAGAPKPLPERFMIPGLQHDDKWRMVEDEFVAMAHKFTAHLHAAEYQRLKKMAEDLNADAIQSLSRPVTAPMTDRVKRRKAVLSLKKSQRSSIKKALSQTRDAEQDEFDEVPWAGTNLEGLMDSPRKKIIPLTRMVSTTSDTRAAALRRKDSVASPRNFSRSDGIQHLESPSTAGKPPAHFSQPQNEDDDGHVQRGSISRRHTAILSTKSHVPNSSDSMLQRASSTALGRVVKAPASVDQKPAPVHVALDIDDDSDSPVETMFGQHFRERRNKRRNKSSAPETSKAKGQPSEKSTEKGPVRNSLSIPSF